jgi:hypothetical protein
VWFNNGAARGSETCFTFCAPSKKNGGLTAMKKHARGRQARLLAPER